MAGSFLNIGAVARRCVESEKDLFIFPSGDQGNFSLEDTLCGGMLIDLILKREKEEVVLTDASYGAQVLFQRFKDNLVEAFHLSHHGKELIHRGFEEDLAYCAQIDMTPLVPIFRQGVIKGK